MPERDSFQFPTEESSDPAAEDFSGLPPEAETPDQLTTAEDFEDAAEASTASADGQPVTDVLLAEADVPLAEDDKHWYIIHTYSGFEEKVAESLRTRADAFGFSDRLGQILVPREEVVENRGGKRVTTKRMLYPGYVLVQMEMSDQMRHYIKDTPRVTGFVGGGTDPVPLTADEVNGILYRQASSAERPRPKLTFEKNETVRIVDGPFTNFAGKVDEVNPERSTLRVLVTIFGRATPVELDFLQVEKT